jgi:putative endonuclease
MFFYSYILRRIKNHSLYIGHTSNLRKRFLKHNSGHNKTTKPFIPYQLIFFEAFINKIDAKNRETYLKGGYGRKTINDLIKKYLKNIKNQVPEDHSSINKSQYNKSCNS